MGSARSRKRGGRPRVLRFVLSHPAVSTAIAGMRSVRKVERNAATSHGQVLSVDQLAAVHRHRWERNL